MESSMKDLITWVFALYRLVQKQVLKVSIRRDQYYGFKNWSFLNIISFTIDLDKILDDNDLEITVPDMLEV